MPLCWGKGGHRWFLIDDSDWDRTNIVSRDVQEEMEERSRVVATQILFFSIPTFSENPNIPLEHTPGIPKPPNERNSFIKSLFRVWGMFQGYVGKVLDAWGNDPIWRAFFSNGLVQPPTRHRIYIYIGFSSYSKCLPFGIGVKLLNTSDKNPGIFFTKLNHTKLLLMDKILHHQGWWISHYL